MEVLNYSCAKEKKEVETEEVFLLGSEMEEAPPPPSATVPNLEERGRTEKRHPSS